MRDRSLPSSLVDDSTREHEHRLHGELQLDIQFVLFFFFFFFFLRLLPPPPFPFSFSSSPVFFSFFFSSLPLPPSLFENRAHHRASGQAESRAKLTNKLESKSLGVFCIYNICCVIKSLCIIDQCQLCRQRVIILLIIVWFGISTIVSRAFTKTRMS